ncbi:unnamed protein product [Gadus morhua 'NCC']
MFTTAFLQIYPVSLGFVFTEILRNRIDRNRDGFARFGFVWTGPKAPREEQSSEEDTASCSSLSSMSRSSSCSSSSSSDEKMKRKGKGKLRLSKTKNKIKKARKHHKVTDAAKEPVALLK